MEQEIMEYFGVKYVFFVSSGKAAFYLILQALQCLSPAKRVIVPAFTCFSVPSAIVKAGLTVSPCDIDPVTLDFDPALLGDAINEDTLCVVPNHLFGIPSNLDLILTLSRERRVFVVEDAAQAMGVRQNGQLLGTIGDVGFFSLARGKRITCGAGGIIVTNSTRIANSIANVYSNVEYPSAAEEVKDFLIFSLMTIFIQPWLYSIPVRLPFLKLGQTIFDENFPIAKLSNMKAGLLYSWRENLDSSNRTRSETVAYYKSRCGFNIDWDPFTPYLRLPLLVGAKVLRERIIYQSRQAGLGIGPMYPTALDHIEELRSELIGRKFPVAERIAEELLTIPTHNLISQADKIAICDLLNNAMTPGEA